MASEVTGKGRKEEKRSEHNDYTASLVSYVRIWSSDIEESIKNIYKKNGEIKMERGRNKSE